MPMHRLEDMSFLKSKKSVPERFFLSKNVTMDQGFLFDIYAGYNYGKIHNFYEGISQSHFDTNKFYLQAGAHWAFRIGTLSYTFRTVYLNYSNGSAKGEIQEEDLRDLFDGGIADNNPYSFYETSFRYQIGIRQVRIYTGVTTKHQKDNIRPNSEKRVCHHCRDDFLSWMKFSAKRKKSLSRLIDDEALQDTIHPLIFFNGLLRACPILLCRRQ